MARNASRVLTPAEKGKATRARKALTARQDQTVTVNYVKRDGTPATLTGQMVGFVGEGDTAAVTLAIRGEGYRSANLWAVKSVLP